MTKRKDPKYHLPDGRPTNYKSEYDKAVYKLCLLGAIDTQIADFFGVSEQTINIWKKKHPKFIESIRAGKLQADAEIASKLYHRASGYEHPEDKIFCNNGEITTVKTIKHYPPDTVAAIFWLKNRANWRDKQELDVDAAVSIQVIKFAENNTDTE